MDTNQPIALYNTAQVRALEHSAYVLDAVDSYTLMRRAGSAAFALLRARWPAAKKIAVVCGKGNNAGDGFVLAQMAHQAGIEVSLYLTSNPAYLDGDAGRAFTAMADSGVNVSVVKPDLSSVDVIVDALLGTGLLGAPKDGAAQAILAINAALKPVLSLDIPSGLMADSGAIAGECVRATLTITFIVGKCGLFTGQARAVCGEIVITDLQLSSAALATQQAVAHAITYAQVNAKLVSRNPCAHKGDFGHTLIIGGAKGMGGAARLASESAGRVGSGLVSAYVQQSNVVALISARPEIMAHGFEHAPNKNQLNELLARASNIVLGPGLSQGPWVVDVLQRVIAAQKPLLLDADALNVLAQHPQQLSRAVLTPHPGEAARLLGISVPAVEADRYAAARALAVKYSAVIVLKGAGTLLTDGQKTVVLCEGNPGMASGGMGDVLSGVIGGLQAQGLTEWDAAVVGAALHACAGDIAAQTGQRGMLAGDLVAQLRGLINA